MTALRVFNKYYYGSWDAYEKKKNCYRPCGETQTMSDIVESCPLAKLNGGLSRLHSADEDTVSWVTSYGSWHAYEKKKYKSWFLARHCKSLWYRLKFSNLTSEIILAFFIIIFLYPYVIHITSVDGNTVYNLIVSFTLQIMGVKFGCQALLSSFLAGGAISTRH